MENITEISNTPLNEIKKKFLPKKIMSIKLADSYKRLGYEKKSERVADCGTFLEFAYKLDNSFKLHSANFCRDRLCPMCAWRRSYKIFGQVSQIMEVIGDEYSYIFLTLTVPNCSAAELSKTLDKIQKAWNKLIHYKAFKQVVKGYFKAVECTRSKRLGNYHPHIHSVLAVNKSYFRSKHYLKRNEWLDMWKKATKDNSITQVDVRKARGKRNLEGELAVKALSSAIAEIAKYSVKPSDYLGKVDENGFLVNPFPDDKIDEIVETFSNALHGRRFCSFGGIFEEIRLKLELDDAEDGDLVHIEKELNPDLALQIYRYGWTCGQYKLISITDVNKA